MDAVVWVAIITSTASVAGATIAAWALLRKRDSDAREAAREAETKFKAEIGEAFGEVKKDFQLVIYRIGQLEEEQRKSNNIKERLARNEESTKSAHHRIDEMRDRE